jgi:hypothetical protein
MIRKLAVKYTQPFTVGLVTKYHSGDQIKKEMGRACSTYGGKEKCIQGFNGET